MTNILVQVHEGMDVVDSSGGKIGTVEFLKMTDEDPSTVAVEQLEPDEHTSRNTTIVDNLLDVFRTDGVPQPLHETLLREGFIRIDSEGIFASDRYVLPDQIAEVTDDKVKLAVSKQELIKRN